MTPLADIPALAHQLSALYPGRGVRVSLVYAAGGDYGEGWGAEAWVGGRWKLAVGLPFGLQEQREPALDPADAVSRLEDLVAAWGQP